MQNCDYKKENLTTLVILAQNNDIKAIETLIRQEQRHIYAVFAHLTHKKEDVADLTQETLVKMAKSIGTLKNPKNFRPWLHRIISNLFYDYVKKNHTDNVDFDENFVSEIKDKSGCEPGERCLFSEIEALIKQALMTLPKNLRLSIVLREYEGLSYEDISKVTNTTIGTVKSRISRARLRLKEVLSDFL